MEEFGIERFDGEALPQEPKPPRLFQRKIVFGQRGFDPVLERIRTGGDFAVMSGLMPSGKMHLGHKMVIDQVLYFQDFGAKVFVGVADLEAYGTRGVGLKQAEELAVNSYISNYLALGLGKPGLEIYFQSKRGMVKDLALNLAVKVNLSMMRAIYGFDDRTNISHLMAPLIQAGDILHPQIKLGPIPVVVPVGIDQDPHMRLCRDLSAGFRIFNATLTADGRIGVFMKTNEDVSRLIDKAETVLRGLGHEKLEIIKNYKAIYILDASPSDVTRMDQALAELETELGDPGFLPPASTYHRFIRGLTGEKMSSSRPETAVFLGDPPEEGAKKLKRAITGGRETAEEQRKLGGDPDRCSIFETMLFHTVEGEKEIERIEEECRSGQRLCGGCKKEAAQYLEAFLKDLAERRDQTAHQIKEYVMDD